MTSRLRPDREIRNVSELIFYIAGPMTNRRKFNYPMFTSAAENVRAEFGARVISPHELDHGDGGMLGTIPWEEYIRTDIEALLQCDAIVLLPEWYESRGARLECRIAAELGFYFFDYKEVNGKPRIKRRVEGNLDVLI